MPELESPALDEDIVRQEFDYVARKLQIWRAELKKYFDAPKWTYRDFKAQEWIYSGEARLMGMLGLEFGRNTNFGTIGAAAGSLFVFRARFRAVLISYPTRREKDRLVESAMASHPSSVDASA